MRFLPILLLLAAPLLAQEPSEEQRRAEEARKAAEEALEAQRRAQVDVELRFEALDERTEQLRRLIHELGLNAKREQAMEALRKADLTIEELLRLTADALARTQEARSAIGAWPAARTLYLGTETISGSADGTEYKLKSLGDGKYELHATKRAEDGRLMEEWTDKGTLKELQEKFAFLRSGLALQVPAAPAGQIAGVRWGRVGVPLWTEAQVQYDSAVTTFGGATWNGGGRVGVTVHPTPEELRFHLELPEGAGFIVQQVVPGSRAEQIGIRRMDILLRLDGELIDSPLQLKKLHEKKGVLEIIRRAVPRKIDLSTLPEEKPADAVADKTPEPTPATDER